MKNYWFAVTGIFESLKTFLLWALVIVFTICTIFVYSTGTPIYMAPIMGARATLASLGWLIVMVLSILGPSILIHFALLLIRLAAIGIIKIVAVFYPSAKILLSLFEVEETSSNG